jgi:hypothetical protein
MIFFRSYIQSDLGQEYQTFRIDTQKTDSIILFEPGLAYYYKSEAAFEIAKKLEVCFI